MRKKKLKREIARLKSENKEMRDDLRKVAGGRFDDLVAIQAKYKFMDAIDREIWRG